VFRCDAPDPLNTEIVIIRCAGDARYQFSPLSLGLLQRCFCGIAYVRHPTTAINSEFVSSTSRTGARKYDHVRSLLCDHHWLPIAERIEYKLCTLVFRCLQGNAPRYLADHVILMSSVGRRSGLRSADTLTLVVPRTHLSFIDRAFSVAGPRAWNSLPLHVRSAQSMYTFRKLLKTYLFQRVYL
jgi:hypothetical protein